MHMPQVQQVQPSRAAFRTVSPVSDTNLGGGSPARKKQAVLDPITAAPKKKAMRKKRVASKKRATRPKSSKARTTEKDGRPKLARVTHSATGVRRSARNQKKA
jgi:hypothetical protein